MNRSAAVLLIFCAVLSAGFVLVTCDQDTKKVALRFKFQPGMALTYQRVLRGLVQVTDRNRDVVLRNDFAETTADIDYRVRRILEDSTAEIIDSKKWQFKTTSRLDSIPSDTAARERERNDQVIKYIKPNGRVVDMEFVSDITSDQLEYFKELYKQGTPVFPNGDIGQGHSWTQTTTVVLPDGPMEASTTYTIRSFTRERGYDCVVIEYDGNSIIPLPAHEDEKYDMISGVDLITSKGHLYFAYKEGIAVLVRERWILDGDRTLRRNVADTVHGYNVGDTVSLNVSVEYDAEHSLLKAEMP